MMTLAFLGIMVATTAAVLVAFHVLANRLERSEHRKVIDLAAEERRSRPGLDRPRYGHPAGDGPIIPWAAQVANPTPPPTPQRAALRARSRLVFADSNDDGITLDCTLIELDGDPAQMVPTGAPFTLQLRPPDTGWFSACVEGLLEQWADDERLLEVEIQPTGDGWPRANLSDGASRVVLELETAAGLTIS